MERFRKCDLHCHSVFSKDAARDMTFENLCAAAAERGIGMLAVTDHYDIGLPYKFDPAEREPDFLEARERFKTDLTLLRGLELGQMMDGPVEAAAVRSAVPYDAVIGSIHAPLPYGDFYALDYGSLSDEDLKGRWDIYLTKLTELAEKGDFDILAHIRYPERYFIRAGKGRLLPIEAEGEDMFEPVFRALIRRDKSLEINTAVVRKYGLAPDPGLRLLKFYRSLGGKHVSVGSDAHRPGDVGADIDAAIDLAEAAGFGELTVFSGRKIRHIHIGGGNI